MAIFNSKLFVYRRVCLTQLIDETLLRSERMLRTWDFSITEMFRTFNHKVYVRQNGLNL